MHGPMINPPRHTRVDGWGGPNEDQTGNDNDRKGTPPVVCLDDDAPVLAAVARLSTPGPERRDSLARMTASGWETLGAMVGVLSSVAHRVGLDDDLRWRVMALQRAVDARDPSPFPLALGGTGREPPPAVIAWSYERGTPEDLPEVAVWFLADAACALAEGEGLEELRGAWAVLDAWADTAGR